MVGSVIIWQNHKQKILRPVAGVSYPPAYHTHHCPIPIMRAILAAEPPNYLSL